MSRPVRDKQKEETHRRLYLAALEVFERDGVDNCRIDDITQKAEVSRAAFYFHFPTKDHVLIELLRASERPVEKAIVDLPTTTPIEQVLEASANAMADFWVSRPALLPEVATVGMRLAALSRDRDNEPVRAAMTTHFRAAWERGELSQMLPPEVLADFFLMNALAAMVAWSGNQQLPLTMVLGGVAQLFLQGAGVRR